MKKVILILTMFLVAIASNSQKNSYVGSVIIPKGGYFVIQAGTNHCWGLVGGSGSREVVLVPKNSPSKKEVQFIPAGNGFYFIKIKDGGFYLSIKENGKTICADKAVRSENQKFKVVNIGSGKFKFISANNLALSIVSSTREVKPGKTVANSLGVGLNMKKKLKVSSFTNNKAQIFEIVEAASGKTWKGE